MRRTGVLLAAVALVVSGCGGSKPTTHAWAAALQQVRGLEAATYDVVSERQECSSNSADVPCTSSELTFREHGTFTVDPDTWDGVMEIDRSPTSSRGLEAHLRMRQLADGSLYQQGDVLTGGCWVRLPPGSRQINPFLKLDAALKVLRNASVPHDGPSTGSSVELDGRAPAMDVLLALGILDDQSPDQVFPGGLADELQGVRVPITLLLDADGAPRGFNISGMKVSAFLSGTNPDTPRAYAVLPQRRSVSFRLSKLGVRQHVEAPRPEQVRPTDAPYDFECPKS